MVVLNRYACWAATPLWACAGLGLGGCQLIEGGIKAYDTIDGQYADNNIRLSDPGPFAAGMQVVVEVEDACKYGEGTGCSTDEPVVENIDLDPPFELVETSGSSITVRANDVGVTTLRVTSDEGETAERRLEAVAPTIELTLPCPEVELPLVAADSPLRLGYDVRDAAGAPLSGSGPPPIEGHGLVFERSPAEGRAVYRTPETPGELVLRSRLDGSELARLLVYNGDDIEMQLEHQSSTGTAPPSSSHFALRYWIAHPERGEVDAFDACVGLPLLARVQTETPTVCTLFDPDTASEQETLETYRTEFQARMHTAGTCRILATLDGSDAMDEIEVEH